MKRRIRVLVRELQLMAACLRHGAIYGLAGEVITIRKGSRCIRLSRKHSDFAPEMAKHFDQYASQVVSENGVVDYSAPRLHRYAASGLEFELSSLPEEQGAIDDYFRCHAPRSGDLVFDIGAYCGVSTFHFAKAVGDTGRVIAFEPDAGNFRLLVRNCERHNLTNVIPVQLAIAGRCGHSAFNSEATLGSGLSRYIDRPSAGDTCEVETVTLEEACRRYGIPQFVKMDVEGAELEIIEASRAFLREHAIDFTLDTNHLVNGLFTTTRVEQYFSDSGYEAHSSRKSGFLTTWAHPVTAFSGSNQRHRPQRK